MITVEHLTKTFGDKKAIDDVSFTALDGKVTGFLGPNGAGKSTTMRIALGLIRPNSGKALVDGHEYASTRSPMAEVGAVLNPRAAHRNRTARAHLQALAFSNGISKSRVEEVMNIAGISSVAKKKVGSFSLGMGQRLAIAAALLGDPQNLIFDEPVNGLDPEGVMWVRQLCRYYASQGRCVLLSSHLMSEVAQTADDLVIIGRGRVLERTSVADFLAQHSSHAIRIATPQAAVLQQALQVLPGVKIEMLQPEASDPSGAQIMRVTGMELTQLAQIAAVQQVVIYEFREEKASLEEAYMALTHGQEEYETAAVPAVEQMPTQPVQAQQVPAQQMPAPQSQAPAQQAQVQQQVPSQQMPMQQAPIQQPPSQQTMPQGTPVQPQDFNAGPAMAQQQQPFTYQVPPLSAMPNSQPNAVDPNNPVHSENPNSPGNPSNAGIPNNVGIPNNQDNSTNNHANSDNNEGGAQ